MPDQAGPRPVHLGGAEAIGVILLVLLGIGFVVDIGVSSFMCMDSQDNMACALGQVGGHGLVYVAALVLIALIVYALRRVTR